MAANTFVEHSIITLYFQISKFTVFVIFEVFTKNDMLFIILIQELTK